MPYAILLNLGENAHLNASGNISIGSNDSVDLVVSAGSTVAASDKPQTSASEGNIDVQGSANVSNGSVVAEGNINIASSEGLKVINEPNSNGTHGQVVAEGDLTVSKGEATIYGNGSVSVDGQFSVGNNASVAGTLDTGSADISRNLTVGSQSGSKIPNGSFTSNGQTQVECLVLKKVDTF